LEKLNLKEISLKAKDKAQINVMLQPIDSPEILESERSRHKFMIQVKCGDDFFEIC